MGSNAYSREELLEAGRQRQEGALELIVAVRAADAAETPEEMNRALQRVRDVIEANRRTHAIWRRRWKLAGRL